MVSGVFSIACPPQRLLSSVRPEPAAPLLRSWWGGEENRMVAKVANEWISRIEWDPLVVCGRTGAGKTLLATALAGRWLAGQSLKGQTPNGQTPNGQTPVKQRPSGRAGAARSMARHAGVVWFTGADFARQYAHAIETDALLDFRSRCRQASLLVIDGLEQLAGKPAAQTELIQFFEHESESDPLDPCPTSRPRVLATIGSTLNEADWLAPALASRLAGGLTVPLRMPGLATRRQIVEYLASQRELQLSAAAFDLLAAGPPQHPQLVATVPRLQHAICQLQHLLQNDEHRETSDPETAFSETATSESPDRNTPDSNTPDPDVQLVNQFFQAELRQRQLTLRDISRRVAAHLDVRLGELRGPTRRQHVARARGVAMYLCRQLTEHSLQQVGDFFGHRDHTTVMHACRRTESLIAEDEVICRAVTELTATLTER